MNAFEQVTNLAMISKVEAIGYLFKTEFPECFADLQPWVKSEEARQFCDPDSIDIAFHFSDADFSSRCQSVLMQIKICQESSQRLSQQDTKKPSIIFDNESCKAIGIKLSGYAAYQEQWQFSTIGHWEFSGIFKPDRIAQERFKKICCQILHLFDASIKE